MSEENDKISPNNNKQEDNIDVSESSMKNIQKMFQELLKEQKDLKISNREIVEKLRSAEDEIKKLTQKVEEETVEEYSNEKTESNAEHAENSTNSSDEKTATPMFPMTGKCFVLKHVFTDVLNMKERVHNFGGEEEHFGVKWQLFLWKENEQLALYLKCVKSLSDEKWLISSDAHFKLISTNGKCHSQLMSDSHGNANENTDIVAYGPHPFIEWEKMKEEFVENGKLTAEIHVKIKEMTGIYKENLKNFGDEMKSFSDVVFVVNEKKFFVSKLYLAGHSPYFNSLLLGQFQESKKSEIKLTGIDADDFQNFLEVLYCEQSIDEITVEGILMVADMYDTPVVIRKCEEFLLEKSKKTLKKKLELSIRYNLESLKKKCLDEIKSVADIKSVIPGNIHDLDPSIIAELFQKSLELQ